MCNTPTEAMQQQATATFLRTSAIYLGVTHDCTPSPPWRLEVPPSEIDSRSNEHCGTIYG